MVLRFKIDTRLFTIDRGMPRIRSVRWGVPVREEICPRPSAL